VRVRVRVCTRKEHTAYNTYKHIHIRTQSRGASYTTKNIHRNARAHVARVIVVNARYTGTGVRIATVPAVKQKKTCTREEKNTNKRLHICGMFIFFLSGIYINVNCISEKKKNITTLYNALFVSPVFF